VAGCACLRAGRENTVILSRRTQGTTVTGGVAIGM
jgi:hypothetical protein